MMVYMFCKSADCSKLQFNYVLNMWQQQNKVDELHQIVFRVLCLDVGSDITNGKENWRNTTGIRLEKNKTAFRFSSRVSRGVQR